MSAELVLEAAHISPYKGVHTNRVDNGLLLRSDIHTLFDLEQLTILPTHEVFIHPDLRGSEYEEFHGRGLRHLPSGENKRPSAVLLIAHNERCTWLEPTVAASESRESASGRKLF